VGRRTRSKKAHTIYGVHAVRALLEKRPGAILSATALRGSSAGSLPELCKTLEELGIPLQRVSRTELDQLAQGGTHQGIITRTRGLEEVGIRELEELVIHRGKAFRGLVLDGVQDPRNLGACLRSADAAGADAVIVPKNRAARLTPVALKAATGAAETVRMVRVSNLAATLHWLKEAGVWVVGAAADARRSVYDSRLEAPVVLVIGGEGRGLRRLTRELCDELVSIPMQGAVASLNVSVAAGILLFELNRQLTIRSSGRHGA